MPHTPSRRCAFTLIEIVLVLAIAGCIVLIGLRQLHLLLDRIATRDAVRLAGAVVARARDEAIAMHTPVSVVIDTAAATLELRTRTDTFGRTPVGSVHGVALSATRDSIMFDVRGLGYGAANLTMVARRGVAADTLTVSRLGRVRY